MPEPDLPLSDETMLVHDERHSEGSVSPPIYQTSNFSFATYQSMVDRFRGDSTQPVYSRVDNPTVSVLLDKIRRLEGGEAAAAFSSGMAAISNAILSQVESGDRLVCIRHVYPDTYRLLKGVCARFKIGVATMASGAVMIATTSHGGVTALIVGGLFQGAYREHGLAPENLSRSMEDSVTILEPLMPWTVSAIYMATTLGVPTIEYMPWALFCLTGWMFSLLLAATFPRTGFGLKTLEAPPAE